MTPYLESLKPYCKNLRQLELLQAAIDHDGNMQAASTAMGINKGAIRKTVERVKKYASVQGYAPEADLTHPVASTQFLKGASTLYDEEGNVKLQWIKSHARAEEIYQSLEAIAQELSESITPIPQTSFPAAPQYNDLLNMHVLTDYHLGMFAWEATSGNDWDTATSEQFLLAWFKYTIEHSPDADVGLLLNLGDFFHTDSIKPATPTSGHLLDVDVPYAYLVRTGIRLMKEVIKLMTAKYNKVVIYNIAGNHDESSTIWFRELLASYYSEHSNIYVETSPDLYQAYKHGDTSLFFHHGHKKKITNIQETLIARFRDIFGSTTKSYAHIGHYHHMEVKESATMTVEQHRTMAAKDAYSANGGYMSDRSAYCITYHKKHGEVSRTNVSAQLIESLLWT